MPLQQVRRLEYAGPYVPKYKPLPSTVKLLYGTAPVVGKLSDDAEEAVVNYGRLLEAKNKHIRKRTFNQNFFNDFRALLTPRQRDQIREFRKLNFGQITVHLRRLKEASSTPAEKKKRKETNDQLKQRHGVCKKNGKVVEELGVWMVEPSGIFIGRPDNPRHGRIKLRIRPSDVVVNCSGACPPPPWGNWKAQIFDPSQAWVAKYTNNLKAIKYIFPGIDSSVRKHSDVAKFEVAQSLGRRIAGVRKTYEKLIAMRLIDNLGSPSTSLTEIGNEKGPDAADTVGCTTLRKEHISLKSRHKVCLDFKGKDSIRLKKEFEISLPVFNAISRNIRRKRERDQVFDLIQAQTVNKYLKDLGDNYSAKVFRTFNASKTFDDKLHMQKMRTPKKKLTIADKLFIYKKANLAIAKLCNHQKTVNTKLAMRALGGQKLNRQKKQDKLRILKEKLKGKVGIQKLLCQRQISKLEENIKELETRIYLKDEGMEYALGTSQANYLDPRITVAWCKRNKVPLEKVWSANQRKKYVWANKATSQFRF